MKKSYNLEPNNEKAVMRLFLSFLAILIFPAFCYAQSLNMLWSKTYGCTINEKGNSMVIDRGKIIMAGGTSSPCTSITPAQKGKLDAWVAKTDDTGKQIWSKRYGGSDDDELAKIIPLADASGFVALGITFSNDGDVSGQKGDGDWWIIKINNDGDLVWQKTFGGTKRDQPYDIVQTPDGGFIAVGQTQSDDGDITARKGIADLWIIKVNSGGSLVWSKTYGCNLSDIGKAIQTTADGNYIVAGVNFAASGDATKNNGQLDVWLLKVTDAGSLLWEKSYGGSETEYPTFVKQTKDGGYIIAAYSVSNDHDVTGNYGQNDLWIIKTDNAGNLTWQKNYGGTQDDYAYFIAECIEGGYLVLGATESNDKDIPVNRGGADVLLIKLGDNGNLEESRIFGGSSGEGGGDIIQLADSTFMVLTTTQSNNGDVTANNGASDAWLMRLSRHIPASVKTIANNNINVYPTYTRDVVKIKLQDNKPIQLRVINISGQLINAPISKTADGYTVDLSTQQTGWYYLHLIYGKDTGCYKVFYLGN